MATSTGQVAPRLPVTVATNSHGAEATSRCAEVSAVSGVGLSTQACLFDLNVVLTQTATVHAAWEQVFDAFVKNQARTTETPFDTVADYNTCVDGKNRTDGTQSSRQSRAINLPLGEIGDRAILVHRVRHDGVAAYLGSGAFGFAVGVDRVGQADAIRAHGVDTVVSDLAELLDMP